MSRAEVVAINVSERMALRDDDVVGTICTLLDAEGDETEEAGEALAAVIEWEDGSGWSSVDLRDFETVRRS